MKNKKIILFLLFFFIIIILTQTILNSKFESLNSKPKPESNIQVPDSEPDSNIQTPNSTKIESEPNIQKPKLTNSNDIPIKAESLSAEQNIDVNTVPEYQIITDKNLLGKLTSTMFHYHNRLQYFYDETMERIISIDIYKDENRNKNELIKTIQFDPLSNKISSITEHALITGKKNKITYYDNNGRIDFVSELDTNEKPIKNTYFDENGKVGSITEYNNDKRRSTKKRTFFDEHGNIIEKSRINHYHPRFEFTKK